MSQQWWRFSVSARGVVDRYLGRQRHCAGRCRGCFPSHDGMGRHDPSLRSEKHAPVDGPELPALEAIMRISWRFGRGGVPFSGS